jgi:uncharacterized protein YqeY
MSAPELPESSPASAVVDRMQADLSVAMKARDRVAVSALRTGLAAIANAEAPPAQPVSSSAEPVVGRLVEHARLELSSHDVDRILRHEVDDRRHTIDAIQPYDRDDEVAELRAEIGVLERYLT